MLAHGNGPDVYVMNFFYTNYLFKLFFDSVNIVVTWGALHENVKAVLEDRVRLVNYDDRENVGANGVGNGRFVIEVDDNGGNDDTD